METDQHADPRWPFANRLQIITLKPTPEQQQLIFLPQICIELKLQNLQKQT